MQFGCESNLRTNESNKAEVKSLVGNEKERERASQTKKNDGLKAILRSLQGKTMNCEHELKSL